MVELPDNWGQLESEHNRHYDPYAIRCSECGAEDSFEKDEDDDGEFYYCEKCGVRLEVH